MNNTILDFQTGRWYGPTGQRITAMILDTEHCEAMKMPFHRVAFIDHTRGLAGIIGTYDFTPESILRAYDQGGYDRLSSYSEAYKELSA